MLMAELKYERFRQEANKIIHGTNTKAGRLFDLFSWSYFIECSFSNDGNCF
jgi:hypothetical protein